MARKTQERKIESIYNKVKQNPGKRVGFIARSLGLNRSEVTRSLPVFEKNETTSRPSEAV